MRAVLDADLHDKVTAMVPVTVPDGMTPHATIAALEAIHNFYDHAADTACEYAAAHADDELVRTEASRRGLTSMLRAEFAAVQINSIKRGCPR